MHALPLRWPSTSTSTRRRILVVDDDQQVLKTVESLLLHAGFDVACHADLGAARAALASGPFDLVLTDLFMDGAALGYEIAEIARAQRPPIPVILLTARPSFGNAVEAMRSRVLEIVVKPIDGHALIGACKRAIEQCEIRTRNESLEAHIGILKDVLPRCIEANDPMTRGHSERVVHLADGLARRCQIGDADRESLRLAALLHDVGKIGIPSSILTKDGPLTVEEREVIRRHPRMGYEILEPLRGEENARQWVYQHHERWDGKGYPERLGGEDVALPGRILVLAEVFDALASPRSYKPAWEISRIAAFFRHEAGQHFDPELSRMVASGIECMGARFFAPSNDRLF